MRPEAVDALLDRMTVQAETLRVIRTLAAERILNAPYDEFAAYVLILLGPEPPVPG